MERGFRYIQKAQNDDGGWGYYAGKMSFTEPTSLAVLALGAKEAYKVNLQKGAAWLTNQQRKDGGWKVSPNDDEASWVTSLAVIAMTAVGVEEPVRDSGISWLLNTHGYLLSGKRWLRLNTKARGWPWLEGNASWVEPTAYALIALKLAMRIPPIPPLLKGGKGGFNHLLKGDFGRISQKIQDAEALLFDTVCEGGGWNYGSNHALGVNLRPFISTTAIALVALQGCEENERVKKVVRESLNYIKTSINHELSALSLAWSIICLDIYGEETAALCASLRSLQKDNGSWEDNACLTALALLALETREGRNTFKIEKRVI